MPLLWFTRARGYQKPLDAARTVSCERVGWAWEDRSRSRAEFAKDVELVLLRHTSRFSVVSGRDRGFGPPTVR
jgi:hypothetical protein